MSSAPWKMRYAGHLGLRGPDAPLFRRSARSTDPVDQIDFLADLGFAGVADIYLKLRPPEVQARIGVALAARGLLLGTFNAAPAQWATGAWTSGEAEGRQALLAEVETAIEAAQRAGGGGAGVCVTPYDPARPREAQLAAFVDNLRRLAEPAERGGLVLLVEPVAAAFLPGFLIDRLAEAEAVVRAVGHPAVRLLFDFAHVQTSEGETAAGLARVWDIVGAVQAADTPGRRDLGAGELDWPNLLRGLRDRGYAGLVEIEHEAMDDSLEGEQRLIERLRAIDAAI